jgi:dipeptide/tripeptide permease
MISQQRAFNWRRFTHYLMVEGQMLLLACHGLLRKRREKKKEESRTHNAQLHATITVAGVAAAIAVIAAATSVSSIPNKDAKMGKTDMAVASAATLVAAQCMEAAEAMGAERDHLASVVSSAVCECMFS